jgi:hypothetical protein
MSCQKHVVKALSSFLLAVIQGLALSKLSEGLLSCPERMEECLQLKC